MRLFVLLNKYICLRQQGTFLLYVKTYAVARKDLV
jgi:hypothetical protein